MYLILTWLYCTHLPCIWAQRVLCFVSHFWEFIFISVILITITIARLFQRDRSCMWFVVVLGPCGRKCPSHWGGFGSCSWCWTAAVLSWKTHVIFLPAIPGVEPVIWEVPLPALCSATALGREWGRVFTQRQNKDLGIPPKFLVNFQGGWSHSSHEKTYANPPI